MTIRPKVYSVSITWAWHSTPRCEGGDTDTVAAIAGGLLGAAYGTSVVPAEWRRLLHGWPGLGTRDLVALATRIVKADKPFSYDIDPLIPLRHPQDDGVWLGNVIGVTAHTNKRICVSRN